MVNDSMPGHVGPISFTKFYQVEYPGCARLAWLLSHGSIDSEDIVQDAFAAVFHRFDSLDNPAAYLRVTVVNGCRQHHRRLQRELARGRRAAAEWTRADSSELEILSIAAHLPYNQRAVLALRYWADMPDVEIASLLGIRPTTVRTRLHRATMTIRKGLES
jgi:RNA polymerase sigma factor (sigma-70 family)